MKLFTSLPVQTLILVSSLLSTPTICTHAAVVAGQEARAVRVRPFPPGGGATQGTRVNTNPPKYFQEPGGDEIMGHYDSRYFKDLVAYEDHKAVLRHLIRSYLQAFRQHGLETWLAHGTLLGWWWNGRIMPWDYDLDVQVSYATLDYLGEHFNRTMHEYTFVDEETGMEETRTYLLDINPNHRERLRLDGMNVIDGRWIDTSNGMFIDITGLAERDPESLPGVWSCKNYHRYRTRDLYPMRETEFEGVPATVPYNFERVLTEEYGMKCMVQTTWQGHHWVPEQKEWVKLPTLPTPGESREYVVA